MLFELNLHYLEFRSEPSIHTHEEALAGTQNVSVHVFSQNEYSLLLFASKEKKCALTHGEVCCFD